VRVGAEEAPYGREWRRRGLDLQQKATRDEMENICSVGRGRESWYGRRQRPWWRPGAAGEQVKPTSAVAATAAKIEGSRLCTTDRSGLKKRKQDDINGGWVAWAGMRRMGEKKCE